MRFTALAIALVLLATVACATSLTQVAQRAGNLTAPAATPTGTDIDRAFVTGMVPHHQAAIDMAMVEVQNGKRSEVKQLAQRMIGEQQREITELQRIGQQDLKLNPSTSTNMTPNGVAGSLMGEPILVDMSQMAAELSAATDTDRAFLQMMVPHHAMAIVMADTEARRGNDAALKTMGQSIVSAQAQEIGVMENLLPPP
jgi:uncharacterized protein (DUF305 family)